MESTEASIELESPPSIIGNCPFHAALWSFSVPLCLRGERPRLLQGEKTINIFFQSLTSPP